MAVRDVHGNGSFTQDNGFEVQMRNIRQANASERGVATLEGDATTTGLDGAVTGFVDNQSITFTIDWDRSGPGKGGRYRANFSVVALDGSSVLSGSTFDLDLDHGGSGSTAAWQSFGSTFQTIP
ncbi:hypothetical protein [Streptomyces sp. NPDC005281]|uniref:hypothetical protein n=1 Tax=Streptomyces sp. NPDC005281 TaxID=3155712 RepID=UPI0033A56AD4